MFKQQRGIHNISDFSFVVVVVWFTAIHSMLLRDYCLWSAGQGCFCTVPLVAWEPKVADPYIDNLFFGFTEIYKGAIGFVT